MEKYALYPGTRTDGRPNVHLIEPGTRYGLGETADLEKTASGEHLPEVLELVESIAPQPDRIYILNSALGAGEKVGFNLRGDWFGQEGLTHTPPGWDDVPVWDIDGRRKLANHTEHVPGWGKLAWGYPTFYNAHRFRHHQNKDPNRAYGYILGAFWDERMCRVILVSELLRSLCMTLGALDVYDRIARGEFPDTSMGAKVPFDVCFSGETYVTTEMGPRQIRDIQVGDRVYTQQGNLKEVTQLFRRTSDGLLRLSVGGVLDVETTSNHPYFRLRRESVRGCHGSVDGQKRRHSFYGADTCRTCGASGLKIEEIPAEDLRTGDYLVTPVLKAEGPEYGPTLSYVAGVYAGDGSPIRQRRGKKKDGDYVTQGLVFACGANDAHIDKLCAALSELSDNEPRVYDEGGDKNGVSVRIYDQELAAKILGMITGKGSSKNLIVPLAWHEDRLSFLGGLIDSDGSYDEKKRQTRFLNTSPQLARTAWWLGVQSRIHTTMSTYEAVQGYSPGTRVFQVAFPASSSAVLSHYACKVQHREAHVGSVSFFWNSGEVIYYCSPIQKIEEVGGEREVFNLSVEGDETYIAEGMAVHNCDICGHVARSPSQYCQHVRRDAMPPYGMRSILPDGRMCGVRNPYPRFFDDSLVFVGAERSAKTMSNLTERVKGQREYTQQVYPFSPPIQKVANAGERSTFTGRDEILSSTGWGDAVSEERQGARAIREEMKERLSSPEPDDSLNQKLERIFSGLPLTQGPEREVLRFLHDRQKALRRCQSGDLSQKEFSLWEGVERARLKKMGVGSSQIQKVEEGLRQQIAANFHEKEAGTKWGEILKEIPAPPPGQVKAIRAHESTMPDLPREVLDDLANSPGEKLRAAARLGIVLKPHEFQYCMLRLNHPEEAEEHWEKGEVFSPAEVDPEHHPKYNPHSPISPETMEKVRELLGSLLSDRSMAPKAVRIRILRMPDSPPSALKEASSSLLNEVAKLYNEYRSGLIVHPLDLQRVDLPIPPAENLADEAKLASLSKELSEALIHLAYWPSIPVG